MSEKRQYHPPDANERATWVRHSLYLALLTAGFHFLQFVSSMALWSRTNSAALAAFGFDAVVSSFAALILARRIRQSPDGLTGTWQSRSIGYGYILSAAAALYLGGARLWLSERPAPSILGIMLAAISMLVIPIIGSYLKTLAVELRNQPLKSAAIFTFANSYLSMVLLISLLLNAGMDLGWGDPLGAIVMSPFLAQKGIQILIEREGQEYVEEDQGPPMG